MPYDAILSRLRDSVPEWTNWRVEHRQYLCTPWERGTHTSIGVRRDRISARLNLQGTARQHADSAYLHLRDSAALHTPDAIEKNDPDRKMRVIVIYHPCDAVNMSFEALRNWCVSRGALVETYRQALIRDA